MKYLRIAILTFLFPTIIYSQNYELVVPLGHTNKIKTVVLNANKTILASADGSPNVILWDYISGKELYHLEHLYDVEKVAWLDSLTLITTSDGGEVKLWQNDGILIREKIYDDTKITAINIEHDRIIVAFDNLKIKVLDKELDETASYEINNLVTSLNSTETNLYIGYKNGLIEKYELSTFSKLETDTASINAINSSIIISDTLYLLSQGGYLIKMDLSLNIIKKEKLFSKRGFTLVWDKVNKKIIATGRDDSDNLKLSDTGLEVSNDAFNLKTPKAKWKFSLGIEGILTTGTTVLIANYDNEIVEYNLKTKKKYTRKFQGYASSINGIDLNNTGEQLAVASNKDNIKVIDLTGTKSHYSLTGHPEGVRSVDFNPANATLASSGTDEKIRIWNVETEEQISIFNAKGKYISTPIRFDPTGNYILKKNSEKDFDLYNFKKKKPKSIKIKNGYDFKYSNDGKLLLFRIRDNIQIADPISLEIRKEFNIDQIKDFVINSENKIIALLRDRKTLKFIDIQTGKELSTTKSEVEIDKIGYINNSNVILGYTNKILANTKADYNIYAIDSKSGKTIKTLNGHKGFIKGIEMTNGKYLTSSVDGVIKIWNNKFDFVADLIPLEDSEYVVVTPNGLFDATDKAIKQLHYVYKGKIIEINQLKDQYYEPNLLSKLLGFNKEPILKVDNIQGIKMHPEFTLEHPYLNDGVLGININANNGGIGKIVVAINGKELPTDMRGSNEISNEGNLTVKYDLNNHPFMYNDKVSSINIYVYNEDNSLRSQTKTLKMIPVDKKEISTTPHLYGMIVGTSDYTGKSLDLKYAAKDANDFTAALELSASKLLGSENVDIHLLTTDNESKSKWPIKENILSSFNEIASKATSKDILIVYFSGHGVNLSGENSDFYYLTSAASDGDLSDDKIRNEVSLSSSEITKYIQTIAALKQVLILDACHSGKAASNIAKSRSAVSSTQKRALESMKDKTGLHILAGSAADAVSYETTLYGQGLLTYSLLFGMKGAALQNGEYIDVLSLLQFAAKKVPELAKDIGGIQQPEVRSPIASESFYLGRLDDEAKSKIKIEEPKPVYVYTQFQSEDTFYDHFNISNEIDAELLEMSSKKESEIVFINNKKFSGAYIVIGRYKINDEGIEAKVKVFKDDLLIKAFEKTSVNSKLLITEIVSELMTITN